MAELDKQTIEHPMITRSKAGIFKPKVYSTQCKEYRMELNKFEPNNVFEALSNKEWKDAMEEECKALTRNRTWQLVPPLDGQKVIGNK